MQDRLAALLALTLFLAFFGILVFSVKRLDLTLVIATGSAFCLYDMWRQLGPKRRPPD